jgi:uncharacterized protein YkvS
MQVPYLPEHLQRMIAELATDSLIDDSIQPIVCEQLEDVGRMIEFEDGARTSFNSMDERRAIAHAPGWLRGDDAMLVRGKTIAHSLPRVTEVQRMQGIYPGREAWRESHPYNFTPLQWGDGHLGMLDDMNGFSTYCQAVLPWGRAHELRFVYGWSPATLIERRIPVWRVPRYWIVEFFDGLQEGVVTRSRNEPVDSAGRNVQVLENMRDRIVKLDRIPDAALSDRAV